MVNRLLKRVLIVMATALFTVILILAFTAQGRATVRTVLFIPQVLPGIPFKVQSWFTDNPVVTEVYFPTADGEVVADLYSPSGYGKHTAVLFSQGVMTAGRFDSRVVALADALARSGMVVMIPWMDSQKNREIVPQDIDKLVYGFQYLKTLDSVDQDKVGMGGICVGASLATVAAQDIRIRDDVKFVNFLSGYYDLADLARAIGSRTRFGEDYSAPWEPDALTYSLFQYHLISSVDDLKDKRLLVRIFQDKENGIDGEIGSLTEEGTAIYRLLKGVPLNEVDLLLDKLSPQLKEFFRKVSPSTNIHGLSARMFIMHDRGDTLVPSEESRRLAEALTDGNNGYYTEFSLFQKEIQLHVGEAQDLGIVEFTKESFKLFMYMYNIMREVS